MEELYLFSTMKTFLCSVYYIGNLKHVAHFTKIGLLLMINNCFSVFFVIQKNHMKVECMVTILIVLSLIDL